MKKLWILLIIFALGFGAFAVDEAPPVDDAAIAVEEVTEPAPEDSLTVALDGGSMTEVAENLQAYLAKNGVDLLLKLLAAAAIFFIGRFVANLIANLVYKAMAKTKVDPTLNKFVKNLLYTGLLAFVIISALNALGVDTASAAVILGAAGLAVGLALQGSLSNFAAGVLMIIFKPIRVTDFVEVGGATGTVKEIGIFNTFLNGPDNVRIIVPNAQVTGANITNYTVNGTRRVDLVIGVSYEDDIKKAKEVMLGVLKEHPKVLDTPEPFVGVKELADSSVNYAVRPWCKAADYWDVYFDITENVKIALEANGLTIPFPQRDVHMINAPAS
ncbi:MAG: mechanosensitive ion channel family protein [Planctomycetota bacterium]|jgi:small conductance mechanosensitive channel